MTISSSTVRYTANRLTVPVGSTPGEFQARYEQAVPPAPRDQFTALIDRQASWQEMVDLVNAAAPWGFLIYHKGDATPLVRLAGDQATGVQYLMGNHTIMERMYRHEPAVLLYAPLHTVIWGGPEGSAYFTFDKPSDQFASFGNQEVSAVGLELDDKMASLLDHLDVSVPDALLAN
ncbi:MAG TPA: DUF302 domain-containing protein [Acidimicrobiia bacterium]